MLEPEDIAAVHLAVMKPVGIAADEMQAGTTELGRLFSDRFGKRLHILRIERAGRYRPRRARDAARRVECEWPFSPASQPEGDERGSS